MANESSKSDNTRGLACELLASLEVDRDQGTQAVVDSSIEKTYSGAPLGGSRLNGEIVHRAVKLKLGPARNVVETHARLTILTDAVDRAKRRRGDWASCRPTRRPVSKRPEISFCPCLWPAFVHTRPVARRLSVLVIAA